MTRRMNAARVFSGETIIDLKQVPTSRDKDGHPLFVRPPSYQKVQRWALKGLSVGSKHVRLRSRREGGGRVTSVEAVVEFLEAIQ